MSICKRCGKPFDVEDFMDSNIYESIYCPECYYGGNMVDTDDVDYGEYEEFDEDYSDFEEDDYDDEDARTIREALGSDVMGDLSDDEFEGDFDELDDYEERLEFEEGDFE